MLERELNGWVVVVRGVFLVGMTGSLTTTRKAGLKPKSDREMFEQKGQGPCQSP